LPLAFARYVAFVNRWHLRNCMQAVCSKLCRSRTRDVRASVYLGLLDIASMVFLANLAVLRAAMICRMSTRTSEDTIVAFGAFVVSVSVAYVVVGVCTSTYR